MIFGTVRKYFSDIAFELKYREHADGFATDNIPSTRYDRSFHVEAFNFAGSGQNQTAVDVRVPVTVRLFFKGFKNVNETILNATLAGEAFLEQILKPENRLSQTTGVANVIFDQMFIEPYAASNDNSVVCRIEFTTLLFKGIC